MELATQIDLLAQGPNFEDWGDLLIVAVMAILWLAGALAKAFTGRKRPQQQRRQEASAPQQRPKRDTWQERFARMAREVQQAAEAKGKQMEQQARTQAQGPRPRPGQPPAPPAGKVTVRPGPRGESVMVYERPSSQVPTDRQQQAIRQQEAREAVATAKDQVTRPPKVAPRAETTRPGSGPTVESMVDTLPEPPKPLEPGRMELETARQSAGYQPASIIDYNDPDALRKAILHYEILGKPLALRERSEEALSF